MRTYSTIISLIVLVACANATKTVSYSDIVYSLMELNDNPQGLENLGKINESLAESKKKLTQYDEKLKFRCQSTSTSGVQKLQAQGEQLVAIEQAKKDNLDKQNSLRAAQEAAKNLVAKNQEDIRAFHAKVAAERAALEHSERARAERYLIYNRLRTFVQDELTSGAPQRKTDMGAINVDKSFSGKTSFVQLERIRSDLTSIASRASDPMTKSMITTLLMITQSEGKNLFVDQALITKVQGLLSTLMQKEADAFEAEKKAADNSIASFQAMIATLSEEVDRKNEEELMNVAEVASLVLNFRSLENEVKSFTRKQEKQRKKNAIQEDLCNRQEALIKLHANDFDLLESQFKQLKNNLA